MSFVKTLINQNEKIVELENRNEHLENENSQYKHENRKLKSKNEELLLLKNKIVQIMQNADIKKENYFITFEKIKRELEVYQTH